MTETKTGTSNDLVTEFTYDAAGRVLTTTRRSGELSFTSSRTYDTAGRIRTGISEQNLTTTYTYPAGTQTTVTRPGSITEITENYGDGRVDSVTGDNIVIKLFLKSPKSP